MKYKTIEPDFFYHQLTDVAKDMWAEFERLKRDRVTNRTDEGEYLERILAKFLNNYLPKKIAVGRGYVMNQEGETSLQQDIVIYNSDNYVLLKNTEGFSIFPIECVYSTVEVKSTLTKQIIENANNNIESIKNLSAAQLLIHRETGEIQEIKQYGSTVFSTLFAFQADSSLETCCDNFFNLSTAIDSLCILNLGSIVYIDKEESVDEKHSIVRTTTVPNRESDGVMFFEPKEIGPSAMVVGMWLESIISHVKEHGEERGDFSVLNYLKMPKSTYSLSYRFKENP